MKSKFVHRALAVSIVLAAVELLSYAAGRLLQAKWCMYRVPSVPADRVVKDYAEYLRRRDPELGWPLPDQFGSKLFTKSGARPSPACPDVTPETSDIALYGDSFTQSGNSDEKAWGNVLAELSGCRVSNYGQGGYGTDQAYLRFRRNERDQAGVVVLAHVTEDILRVLTRNRDLLVFEMWFAYKPRFILDRNGALELIPIPSASEEDYLRWVGARSPRLDPEHESFHPGGPAGATLLEFPFTAAVLRNLGDFRMRAKLARRPYYAEFYERNHPLRALEILREIGKTFAADAQARGRQPLVLLFPNREDVEDYRETRQWCYGNLVEEFAAAGVDCIEFGTRLAEAAQGQDLDAFYDATGHFNEVADRMVAEFVLAKIRTFDVWSSLPRRSER